MKQLRIDRGTFRMAMRTASGEGDPPRWESDPDGMTLLAGDCNEEENGDCICCYCKQLDCRMCMIEEALRDE